MMPAETRAARAVAKDSCDMARILGAPEARTGGDARRGRSPDHLERREGTGMTGDQQHRGVERSVGTGPRRNRSSAAFPLRMSSTTVDPVKA